MFNLEPPTASQVSSLRHLSLADLSRGLNLDLILDYINQESKLFKHHAYSGSKEAQMAWVLREITEMRLATPYIACADEMLDILGLCFQFGITTQKVVVTYLSSIEWRVLEKVSLCPGVYERWAFKQRERDRTVISRLDILRVMQVISFIRGEVARSVSDGEAEEVITSFMPRNYH